MGREYSLHQIGTKVTVVSDHELKIIKLDSKTSLLIKIGTITIKHFCQ